jgi:hypothetical protein
VDWVSWIYLGANAPFFVYTPRALYSILRGRWVSDTVTVLQVAQRGL